jgi:Fe2+ transport system protein B
MTEEAFSRFLTGLVTVVLAATVTITVAYAASPSQVAGAWEVADRLGGSFLFMVAVSAALERIVTHFQWVVDLLPGESPKDYVLGLLGILVAITMGIGVFAQLAVLLDFQPANEVLFYWCDLALTGLLMGSGAQVVHSWLDSLVIGKRSQGARTADASPDRVRWP